VGFLEVKLSGVAQVQVCPPGSYVGASTTVGLKEVPQCGDCTAGSYCPTPTMKSGCPEGTSSAARSSSQLQCVCREGYVCSYTKLINAVIHLKMTLSQFNEPGVQSAFKNAVAQASRTSASNVNIIKFFELPLPAGGGGGARRLLGLGLGDDDALESPAVEKRGVGAEALGRVVVGGGIHVFLEAQGGGSDLEGLDTLLVGAGLDPSLDHAWYSPHAVEVRAVQ